MSYKIGSFNMFKFSVDGTKDLDKIAEIIISEHFDVIALQEIFRPEAMALILNRIGKNWKGRHASPLSKSSIAAEGYAFLWNTKRIDLAKTPLPNGDIRTYEPRIYNQYRIDRGIGQTELIRNPFFGRFTPAGLPGGAFFELRILNAHIMFSKSRIEDESANILLQQSDVAMRKNEFDVLARTIYSKESDKRYGNNMPAYTLLLGDYNLNLQRPWTKAPYLQEVIEIRDGFTAKRITTFQESLTTLKSNIDEDNTRHESKFANNYDHFTYDTLRFNGTRIKMGEVDAVRKYLASDYSGYRKRISDHVPIIMDLNLIG